MVHIADLPIIILIPSADHSIRGNLNDNLARPNMHPTAKLKPRTAGRFELITILAVIWLGCLVTIASAEQDDESLLIAGLNDRRLFDLAEQHCRRLMAMPNRSPTQTATDSIELIKTRTAKALLATGADRESTWKSIDDVSAEFLKHHANHPRRILVSIQAALAHLARGQQLRQEIVAEMATEVDRTIALEELRLANSQLNDIQYEIQKQIPLQRNRTLTEHELTGEELQILNNQIRLQLANANLNRAMLYRADDRLNRIDMLSSVSERLEEIQRETQPHQPIWWEANSLQIECFRLLNKYPEAMALTKLVAELAAEQTNLARAKWLEQQLLLALDTSDEKASIKYLQEAETVTDRGPQLDLARLATAIDFSLRDLAPGKDEWLNRSAQLARGIEAQHGSYWGRRAKLVLIEGGTKNSSGTNANPTNTNKTATSSAEVDLLISLAEQAERQGRLEDAVKAYDRAASAAIQLKAGTQAFSLAVKAGQTVEKQANHRQAAERFVRLANENPNYELASAAHLRGCWNWGRLVSKPNVSPPEQQSNSKEDREKIRGRYLELLKEHLQAWPQAESANQVRLWLGAEYQSAAKSADSWRLAFEMFLDVPPNSNLFASSIQQAGYCARQWINATEPDEQNAVSRQAYGKLQSIVESSINQSASQQHALLIAVDIGMRYGVAKPSLLIKPLREIVNDPRADQVDPGRRRHAAAWLYAIEPFESDRTTRLEGLLNEISSDKKWLAVADQGIAVMLSAASPEQKVEIGKAREKLASAALDKFGQTMEATERVAWLYRKADAMIDARQTEQALGILEGLEKQLPNDAGVKLRIARLVTKLETDVSEPLKKWRQLAAQLKPNSESWFEAKYNVAQLLEKSGEKAEAKKMLEYMKAIPPGWENSQLRDEFNQLLLRLR
jgi:hypothetical protein